MILSNKKRKRNVILNQGQVSQQKKRRKGLVLGQILILDLTYISSILLFSFFVGGGGGLSFLGISREAD